MHSSQLVIPTIERYLENHNSLNTAIKNTMLNTVFYTQTLTTDKTHFIAH